jgi:hypothetical protein
VGILQLAVGCEGWGFLAATIIATAYAAVKPSQREKCDAG